MPTRSPTSNLSMYTGGAPGVTFAPDEPIPVLTMEPMDVAAFVGVAPRGPAWERADGLDVTDVRSTRARTVAVTVDSWDDYVEHFGAFEAPSLLPHAVASFFAQGGRRAVVLRIVHDEIPFEMGVDGAVLVPAGCAELEIAMPGSPSVLALRARNEGLWGNSLDATLRFVARPVSFLGAVASEVVVDVGAPLVAGALLRLRAADGVAVLRTVVQVARRGREGSTSSDLVATLDQPVGIVPVMVEIVDAELEVIDHDPGRPRIEHFAGLGLDPAHPRWIADVVGAESRLVEVAASVSTALYVGDPTLPDARSVRTVDGEDRWHLVTPFDVFGRVLEGDESGTDGLDALLGVPEVASVVVADLYSPVALAPAEGVETPGSFAGPTFAPCVTLPSVLHAAPPTAPLTGLALDPTDPADLEAIIGLQNQVVAVAERLRCVALLDVPPGLRQRAILRWRSRFDSSYAAAYHPWLLVPSSTPTDRVGRLVAVNPSATAAGVIARCELRQGVPRGPANEPLAVVVDVTDRLDDARHGELHHAGVNAFRRQPDAIWLTGARTISSDRAWRQLSVRRLLLLIERAVAHQLQWVVFEPNDDMLRAGLRRMLDHLLGQLFAQGAFAGATPRESWFIDVAHGAGLGREADQGMVVVQVGVAPSEPTEFIVVRVSLDSSGAVETTLRVGSGVLAHG